MRTGNSLVVPAQERKRMRSREREGRPSKEEERCGIQQRIPEFHAASRDRSTPAHARTNVRGRVPNNRLPLSLGMLRTATGLQIVLTLRVLRPLPSQLPCTAVVKKFPRGSSPPPSSPPSRPLGILNGRTDPAFTYSRRIQLPRSMNRASYESRESAVRERFEALFYTDYVLRIIVPQLFPRLINHRPSSAINCNLSIYSYYILYSVNISYRSILLRFFTLELRLVKKRR